MALSPAGEITPGRDVVQFFRPAQDHLAAVTLRLATYLRQLSGALTIELHAVEESVDGAGSPIVLIGPALISHVEPADDIENNGTIDVFVGPQEDAAGRIFALRIAGDGTAPGHAPTVYLDDAGQRIQGHLRCFVGDEDMGALGLAADLSYAPPTVASTVPIGILYSPVTQCNLACIHCISRDTRTAVRRLPDAIKAQIKGWCDDGTLRALDGDYSGDLLWADTRYPGELDFVLGLGIRVHITTNGVHLTPAVAERLCRAAAALDGVNISLDAATDETFRRVRKGAPALSLVTANIRALVEARARAGATFPVSMSFTLMRSTLDELPAFIRLAASLGVDTVLARHLEAYTEDMEAESLWLDQERFNAVRPAALALAAELGILLGLPAEFDGGRLRSGHRICPVPWTLAAVMGNGDVAACCVPGMTMGNLHEESMEAIWNGPRYQQLRRTVNSPDPPAICNACPMFRARNNRESYLFHRVRAPASHDASNA